MFRVGFLHLDDALCSTLTSCFLNKTALNNVTSNGCWASARSCNFQTADQRAENVTRVFRDANNPGYSWCVNILDMRVLVGC